MENPLTWDDRHRVIQKAIDDWEEEISAGICGYSLPAIIIHRLESFGFKIVLSDDVI